MLVSLPYGAVGWIAVCDCSFPCHTHLLLFLVNITLNITTNQRFSGKIELIYFVPPN